MFYMFMDPEFYESIQRYTPSRELLDCAKQYCDESWQITPGGFWTHCTPVGHQPLMQGWKVHLSGTPATAQDLLSRILPALVSRRTPFKFCSDLAMVRLATSKIFSRTGAGKLVTIYPNTEQCFLFLLEECHQMTRNLDGPYILSDRPYKDSKVVFYRYGGHRLLVRIAPNGNRIPVILSPDGRQVSDERVPFFRVPDWVRDPVRNDQPIVGKKSSVLLKNRYEVSSAIKISSTGGIYRALDRQTGLQVVIREARPRIRFHDDSSDSSKLLEKCARILRRLSETGLVPQFVDFFQEWENLFLVEEFLQAEAVWSYAMRLHLTRPDPPGPAELWSSIRETLGSIVRGLQTIHANGIVLRDFTKTNVLFTPAGQVKFIDFELAYELGSGDSPVGGATPGYASPEQQRRQQPSAAEDIYALGALMLDVLTYSASGLALNREGILTALDQTLSDLGLPRILGDVVRGLIAPEPEKRWPLDRVLRAIETALPGTAPIDPLFVSSPEEKRHHHFQPDLGEIVETTAGIADYILAHPDYSRTDRLWPTCPQVFDTNPVGIEFGAAGTSAFLLRSTGSVPRKVLEWIVANTRPEMMPAGLSMGMAGVALCLLEMGCTDDAVRILALSGQKDRFEEAGLYAGAAGWGLVNLHFWKQTGDCSYLDAAAEVADRLVSAAQQTAEGLCWPAQNQVPLGLGYGASGIALFLLYLDAVLPSERWYSAAEKAVDFDIAHAHWTGKRVNLFETTEGASRSAMRPHIKHGSCGVATAAIRVYAASGEKRFLDFAQACAYIASSRFSNKLWQSYGLAGLGEFLLDMHHFTGDENFRRDALYLAGGILPHRIRKPEGIAFPGGDLTRISCGFGSGSAGIGMFLHRLLRPKTPRFMLLDVLLESRDLAPETLYAVEHAWGQR